MQQGRVLRFSEYGYTLGPSSAFSQPDHGSDEAADMVSLRSNRTDVENTIFVSTKGYTQDPAGIAIAVDPPHTLNAVSKSASMRIADYEITGDCLPPHIVEQAKQFIERNREALISYWDCEIDTAELIKRLKPP